MKPCQTSFKLHNFYSCIVSRHTSTKDISKIIQAYPGVDPKFGMLVARSSSGLSSNCLCFTRFTCTTQKLRLNRSQPMGKSSKILKANDFRAGHVWWPEGVRWIILVRPVVVPLLDVIIPLLQFSAHLVSPRFWWGTIWPNKRWPHLQTEYPDHGRQRPRMCFRFVLSATDFFFRAGISGPCYVNILVTKPCCCPSSRIK